MRARLPRRCWTSPEGRGTSLLGEAKNKNKKYEKTQSRIFAVRCNAAGAGWTGARWFVPLPRLQIITRMRYLRHSSDPDWRRMPSWCASVYSSTNRTFSGLQAEDVCVATARGLFFGPAGTGLPFFNALESAVTSLAGVIHEVVREV